MRKLLPSGPSPNKKAERVFLAPRRAHSEATEGTQKKKLRCLHIHAGDTSKSEDDGNGVSPYPFDDRFLLHVVRFPCNPLGVLAPTFGWVLVGIGGYCLRFGGIGGYWCVLVNMDDLRARDELGLTFQYIFLFNLQPLTPVGLKKKRYTKSDQAGPSEPFIILKAYFGICYVVGAGDLVF